MRLRTALAIYEDSGPQTEATTNDRTAILATKVVHAHLVPGQIATLCHAWEKHTKSDFRARVQEYRDVLEKLGKL